MVAWSFFQLQGWTPSTGGPQIAGSSKIEFWVAYHESAGKVLFRGAAPARTVINPNALEADCASSDKRHRIRPDPGAS